MKIELSKQDAEHLINMLNTVKIEGIQANAIFMSIVNKIQQAFQEEIKSNNKKDGNISN
jgi:hypothetical protein